MNPSIHNDNYELNDDELHVVSKDNDAPTVIIIMNLMYY